MVVRFTWLPMHLFLEKMSKNYDFNQINDFNWINQILP